MDKENGCRPRHHRAGATTVHACQRLKDKTHTNHARALRRAREEFGHRPPHTRMDEYRWVGAYGYDPATVDWSSIAAAYAEVDRIGSRVKRERDRKERAQVEEIFQQMTIPLEMEGAHA